MSQLVQLKLKPDYRFHSHGMEHLPATADKKGKVETYKGAYISITYKCNTDICEYCYARAQVQQHTMSIEVFRQALDWLEEISSFPEVYLVGGEPTAIANLGEFLDEVAKKKWGATLYTNGAFGPKLRDELVEHPGLARAAFHYETLFFDTYRGFREKWLGNIAALSKVKEGSLLYVFTEENFQYSDPLSIAEEYGLKLTWVFATPTSGRNTPFVGLKTMRNAGKRVQQFLLEAEARGVKTSPDLPPPLCIFDEEFRATYQDRFGLVRRCRPFVYFKPDLSVQFCTAMPVFTAMPPKDADELRDIIARHRYEDTEIKKRTSFPECVDCEQHLHQVCQGGCMTYKVYAAPQNEV